jgi:hypothetical protein
MAPALDPHSLEAPDPCFSMDLHSASDDELRELRVRVQRAREQALARITRTQQAMQRGEAIDLAAATNDVALALQMPPLLHVISGQIKKRQLEAQMQQGTAANTAKLARAAAQSAAAAMKPSMEPAHVADRPATQMADLSPQTRLPAE